MTGIAGWTVIDADDYVVQFDMDNEKYYAWYDTNGEWIGTAYVVNDFTTFTRHGEGVPSIQNIPAIALLK